MNKRSFLIFIAAILCSASVVLSEESPSPAPIRVACVGDSITYGFALRHRDKDCYPVQLSHLLGPKYEVENFGVSATTLLKNGDRPYWKTAQFKAAHDFQPKIVIIMLGTNDSKPINWKHKADYVKDYTALIDSFRKLGSKPDIWICRLIPAYPGRWGITDKVIKNEVNPQIDKVAKKTGAHLIDMYAVLNSKSYYCPDTIHPNPSGAKRMAEAIYTAITGKKSTSTKPAAAAAQ